MLAVSLLLHMLLCAALFTTGHAHRTTTAAAAAASAPAWTSDPTPLAAVTLTMNATLAVPQSWSDECVVSSLIHSMREIADDAALVQSDVILCAVNVTRLTPYTNSSDPAYKNSTWLLPVGFSGLASPDDPNSAAAMEEFWFIGQATQQAGNLHLTLKFVSSRGPFNTTIKPATCADQARGEDAKAGLHAHDQEPHPTMDTCDNGTLTSRGATRADTRTSPDAHLIPGSATSNSNSNWCPLSGGVAWLIGPIVAGVMTWLLVLGVITLVRRRTGAATKDQAQAQDQDQQPEQMSNHQQLATPLLTSTYE